MRQHLSQIKRYFKETIKKRCADLSLLIVELYYLLSINKKVSMEIISIMNDLQFLERQGIISKVQRLVYLDLYSYIKSFDEFFIRKKKLTDNLNMSENNIEKLINPLIKVGLVKKRHVTEATTFRNYGNCLSIILIDPKEIRRLLISKLEKISKIYKGIFKDFLYVNGNRTDLVIADVEDLEGNFLVGHVFIDYKSLSKDFIDFLERGHNLQFEGFLSFRKNNKPFLYNINNIKNITP